MKIRLLTVCSLIFATISAPVYADGRYATNYCDDPNYSCRTVYGDSWESMFPDPRERDVVMRVNRMNINPPSGSVIAVPRNLSGKTLYDVSPFPLRTSAQGRKTIIVDLNKLAWGAYNSSGKLVVWGPASGGKDFCPDEGASCRTPTGNFNVQWKEGYQCKSEKFPIPVGGAAMPFCMHFSDGYALHGSFDVPGANQSHGCVRMFIQDARWLNKNFADTSTKVIVRPY